LLGNGIAPPAVPVACFLQTHAAGSIRPCVGPDRKRQDLAATGYRGDRTRASPSVRRTPHSPALLFSGEDISEKVHG
jgi:hypothetical protein